ncbi:hypothetical protein GPL15_02830 [Clostridium sp. MCC353]|uniref:YdeI/OmpD-associated family protein n=1 Tax=Clostridium sp. MCC353 TaxID=2592646 RepID=UPI001C016276|nr:YdeI/OmpD-associated family protein [Clostridium sp. MCC353]MBT9775442.1 hypothetical protein [Clostridium sp. MCC353]
MPKSLTEKLRLDPSRPLTVLNRPHESYFSEFKILENVPGEPVNIIVLFVKDLEELKEKTMELVRGEKLVPEGRLLIAYPKKGNTEMDTYVHRDQILPALEVDEDGYIKDSLYKFNQMVKLDDTYTIIGIKRTAQKTASRSASQSVGDYIQYIPQIEQELAQEKDALTFFRSLTPGYQRNWARYVYSAKQPETREKRMKEMTELLKQKVKTK